jgi:ABC-type glycerol-3-phosphate transport system substrate-binding protein
MHPNFTIQDEVVPSLDEKLLVALATDTAPDIFTNSGATIQTFMARNALSPVPPEAWGATTIDEMLNKWYLPNVMGMLMSGGKLYGIPNQMNAYSLLVNSRLFKEAGLDSVKDAPVTWDDVARLNTPLTKRDSAGRLTQKGFEFIWARNDQVSNYLQILMLQAGGQVLKDGVNPVFNDAAGVKALQTFKSVTVDPKVTQVTTASPMQDFATEQNAMVAFGPNGGTFSEFINPKMKDNYIYSRLPQINPDKPAATITSFNLSVNGKSSDDKQKVAHDFIRYMAQQPEVWLKATGQLTPMASLQTSATAKEIMPFIDVFIKDLLIAQPPTRTSNSAQLDTALKAACERVVYENQDPKAALDQAAAEFTQAIKQ